MLDLWDRSIHLASPHAQLLSKDVVNKVMAPVLPPPQAAREERIAEKREMLKQEREYNRKKEYARRVRIEVCPPPPPASCCPRPSPPSFPGSTLPDAATISWPPAVRAIGSTCTRKLLRIHGEVGKVPFGPKQGPADTFGHHAGFAFAQLEEKRRIAEEVELARVAEQEAREEAERQRKLQEAAKAVADKQRAAEEEADRKVVAVSPTGRFRHRLKSINVHGILVLFLQRTLDYGRWTAHAQQFVAACHRTAILAEGCS